MSWKLLALFACSFGFAWAVPSANAASREWSFAPETFGVFRIDVKGIQMDEFNRKILFLQGYLDPGMQTGKSIVVRESSASRPNGWEVLEEHVSDGASPASFSLHRDSIGRLYLPGWETRADGKTHGVIRRSDSNGKNWTGYLDHLEKNESTWLGSVGFLADGRPLVTGNSEGGWIALTTYDDGRAWVNLDPIGPAQRSFSVETFGDRTVYVTGYRIREKDQLSIFVRESVDGGKTWTTLDDFNCGGSCGPEKTFMDRQGRLYVAAHEAIPPDTHLGRFGILRRFDPKTREWSTLDRFQFGNEFTRFFKPVVLDSGAIIISGLVDAKPRSCFLRVSYDDGATFTLMDHYVGSEGSGGFCYPVYASGPDRVLSGGGSVRPDGSVMGILRELTVSGEDKSGFKRCH